MLREMPTFTLRDLLEENKRRSEDPEWRRALLAGQAIQLAGPGATLLTLEELVAGGAGSLWESRISSGAALVCLEGAILGWFQDRGWTIQPLQVRYPSHEKGAVGRLDPVRASRTNQTGGSALPQGRAILERLQGRGQALHDPCPGPLKILAERGLLDQLEGREEVQLAEIRSLRERSLELRSSVPWEGRAYHLAAVLLARHSRGQTPEAKEAAQAMLGTPPPWLI